MRERSLALLFGTFALILADPARAGECAVSNVTLALELRQPSWTGGSAGLLEPFATIFQQELGLQGLNCVDDSDCPFSESYGDATCGDLVADPLDHYGVVEMAGVGDPVAFSELAAELLSDARWSIAAQGLITPAAGASRDVIRTFANFDGGFRDVLDVSSTETAPQPFLVDVLVGRGDLGAVGCFGDLLVTRALLQELDVRVLVDPVGNDPPEMMVNARWDFGTLGLGHNVFPLEMSPNATVYVDVYLASAVQATGYNVFDECNGGHQTFDMRLDQVGTERDGIQIFLTPAPTLTVSSRGGLAYEPVPEPGDGAAAGAAVSALAALARCARRRASGTSAAAASKPTRS